MSSFAARCLLGTHDVLPAATRTVLPGPRLNMLREKSSLIEANDETACGDRVAMASVALPDGFSLGFVCL